MWFHAKTKKPGLSPWQQDGNNMVRGLQWDNCHGGCSVRAEGARDPGDEKIKNRADVAVQKESDGDLNKDKTMRPEMQEKPGR